MTALWLKHPLAILNDEARGGIVIENGRVTELVPAGAIPIAEVAAFDASAHVVLPGLVNTHHHFYQTLTRCHPAAMDRTLFGWLQALYPVWARLTPESLDAAVTVAMAELLLSGCTTTTDHHYVFPPGLENAIEIEAAAAAALGIRAVLTRGSMDLSQRDGGLPPDSVVQSADTILADSDRLITALHDPAPHAMLQLALAPCSPFSVTTHLMKDTADLAQRRGVGLHTHLAETQDEAEFCLARFGRSPLDYLEDCNWMRPGTWLAHGIHFSPPEIARLGRARVGVTHCPCSNQVLASGICPACALEQAGAPLGLGVDGSASNDGSNLIQEVRAAFLLQRHANGIEAVSHRDALRWATQGSADCLNRPELGRIEVGAAADLALFKLDELRFSGAGDPIAALVLCGATRADRVMVGGRWVVEDGLIPGLDTHALMRRHATAARALVCT
jgi:8-oxoguanine deaminase